MIIDLSLNIDLRIHYIVDFDAIKAHAQDKYLSMNHWSGSWPIIGIIQDSI